MVPGTGPVHTPNIDPRLLVVAAAILWGTTGTAQALGPDDASPTAVGAARLVVGGVLLGIVAVARGWLRGGIRGWALGPTLVAGAAMAAYQPFFFGGVARIGVAVGTVVGIGSAPVFAGLLGIAVRGERPGRRWLLSTALAVAGTVLLVGTGDRTDVEPLGVALALGAGASYAVYVLATKLLLDAGHPSSPVVAVTFILAGGLLVPVAAMAGVGPLASVDGIAMVAHLGVLTVAVAYLLFGRGLTAVGVGTAGTLTLAEPATAATLGILVLGERPGPAVIVGVLMIGAGLVMLVSIEGASVRRSDEIGQRGRSSQGG
ncbi:MAG: DMT family transporter [Acidimicrobiales bacterium]